MFNLCEMCNIKLVIGGQHQLLLLSLKNALNNENFLQNISNIYCSNNEEGTTCYYYIFNKEHLCIILSKGHFAEMFSKSDTLNSSFIAFEKTTT